jgi:hydrogenase nickel incorporation protein HypA/HybF
MHEYSIIQSLVESVNASIPQGAAVHRIDVRIGDLSGVDCELLATAYDIFRVGTVCEHASMNIDRIPVRWECSKCDVPIERGAFLRCSSCGEAAVLAAGDEIILQRIQLEVA